MFFWCFFRNKPFGMPEMLTFFIIVIIRFKVAFLARAAWKSSMNSKAVGGSIDVFVWISKKTPRSVNQLISRWRFWNNFFLFTPDCLGKWSNLTCAYFSTGWFNHQADLKCLGWKIPGQLLDSWCCYATCCFWVCNLMRLALDNSAEDSTKKKYFMEN